MYYESFGSGRPIVFLPGWGGNNGEDQATHEPVFATRSGWRRIYIDPPGTNHRRGDPSITDQDGMLDAIAADIGEVVGSNQYAVAGTSAGGLHARGLIKRDPARILGLLLRVPGVIADHTHRTLPTDEYLQRTSAYAAAWQAKQDNFYDPAEQSADLEFLGRIQSDPTTYGLRKDPAALFVRPTLIVTGRQDTVTGYDDAWDLLIDYPTATYAVLDQEGHDLPARRPALYHALVADWLDRMEASWPDR
ncbi:alpha/beta hydrolase [Kribbella albertanoniae]|uniref:Alpha/beta hydrolase n=1 Tax=Kribbella albertanoniae TaxID=1266829 RepID=A0A4R4PAG5_9ACTN|nr:alpha/beta hydrolase [Kribbella albertanoniae]TDC17933.1 alpha/beta hydrolase [Kribbella albertanoniae]